MKNVSVIVLFLVTFLITSPGAAQDVNWLSLSEAQELAVQDHKKVMIYAEAEWCGYCKKMNQKVFPTASVQDSLSKYFYPVRIDIESNKKITFNGDEFTERSLANRFRVTSTPTVIFLNAKGKIIGAQPGYMPAEIFDKLLAFVGDDKFGNISFKAYLKEHGVEL